MDRLVVAALIVAVVAGASWVLRRRRSDAPTQVVHSAPHQLDRSDFDRQDAEWLVVVFTSATCHTCADVLAKAVVLDSPSVGVVDVEFTAHRDVHRRYAIDAVPALVLADRNGVVQRSFIGRVSATDLWAAVAELREPGSTPAGRGEGCGDSDSR